MNKSHIWRNVVEYARNWNISQYVALSITEIKQQSQRTGDVGFIFLLSNSSSLCGSQARLESSPHSTVRSLSPNKEWQKLFPRAFLSSPLFVWTALANSPSACSFGGNAGHFLTLFAAPLCALWLVSGWNHSAAIDPGSYSTWIWWWLFHDWNINSIFVLAMSHGFCADVSCENYKCHRKDFMNI